MGDRTDATEALHHHRGLPIRPALDEFFETPELDDVQPRLLDTVIRIQQQGHLAVTLHPRQGLDGHAAQVLGMPGVFQIVAHGVDSLSHRKSNHAPVWASARQADR